MPPSLLVANTDSLGERIQRAFPDVKVVKALNTMTAPIMVNPGQLAGGGHAVFVCGDDPEAKALVTGILREFGWRMCSTSATSPPPAPPRWCCRSGCG